MATLHLIRHGQASFGHDNYDKLSPTGWQQGRVLGQSLQGLLTPDYLFTGSLQRHKETAAAMAEGFDGPLPALITEPGLNEFDHQQVIERYRPAWADRGVMAAELVSHDHPRKAFQYAFSEAVIRWTSGQHDADYAESWPDFQNRVWAGIERMITQAQSAQHAKTSAEKGAKHLLAVTSGGAIMVVMQRLLSLDDHAALKLNEVIANAGITRLVYSGERRSLAVFNNYSHLERVSPDLVTFR